MAASANYLENVLQGPGTSPSPQNVVDALVPEAADLVQLFVRQGNHLRLVAFRHIDPEYHPSSKSWHESIGRRSTTPPIRLRKCCAPAKQGGPRG